MITKKTVEEINLIHAGGKIIHRVLMTVAEAVRPGISTWELNELAERLISEGGGIPSFKGYGNPPYPAALCTSVNSEVVHGIPSCEVVLKEGDIISLDIGMRYPAIGGLYTDTAVTVGVGKISSEAKRLIDATRRSLDIIIENLRPGEDWQNVAGLAQRFIESQGFSVIRDLVGHGVGHGVHEDPQLPNYVIKNYHLRLEEGMVLAFEPMVVAGDYDVITKDDDWTVATLDNSLSAHFEHTVAITKYGCEVLT